MRRLIADLYSAIRSLNYERNAPGTVISWLEEAIAYRRPLVRESLPKLLDLQVCGAGKGNIILACLAMDPMTRLPLTQSKHCTSPFTSLIETYEDHDNRGVWETN
jgi:hypothetical protein